MTVLEWVVLIKDSAAPQIRDGRSGKWKVMRRWVVREMRNMKCHALACSLVEEQEHEAVMRALHLEAYCQTGGQGWIRLRRDTHGLEGDHNGRNKVIAPRPVEDRSQVDRRWIR